MPSPLWAARSVPAQQAQQQGQPGQVHADRERRHDRGEDQLDRERHRAIMPASGRAAHAAIYVEKTGATTPKPALMSATATPLVPARHAPWRRLALVLAGLALAGSA